MNKQLQIKCRRSQNNLKRSESDWRWELAFLHPKYVFPWCCKPYFSFSANCISPILKGRRELPCKRGKKSARSALQQKCTLESASISKLLILLKTVYLQAEIIWTSERKQRPLKTAYLLQTVLSRVFARKEYGLLQLFEIICKKQIFVANYFLASFCTRSVARIPGTNQGESNMWVGKISAAKYFTSKFELDCTQIQINKTAKYLTVKKYLNRNVTKTK